MARTSEPLAPTRARFALYSARPVGSGALYAFNNFVLPELLRATGSPDLLTGLLSSTSSIEGRSSRRSTARSLIERADDSVAGAPSSWSRSRCPPHPLRPPAADRQAAT